MEMSRREILGVLGVMAAGGAVAGLAGTACANGGGAAPASGGEGGHFMQKQAAFGWQPHKLDPAECARVAYQGYWFQNYGPAYGVFYSIVGLLGEKYGEPYNLFPFSMLEAQQGAIVDRSNLSGELQGAVSAFALFWNGKERAPMVEELFRWYENTALPRFEPGSMAHVKGDIPASAAKSVFHHISVGQWCHIAGKSALSEECRERCARVSADVAFKAAELFNAKLA